MSKMKQTYDVIYPSTCTERNLNAIIFLHGAFDCRRTWKKVASVIAKKTGRKAYAIDARNHGESSRSKEMNYEVLTQDVIDFMDEHSIKRAVIVGHSMGGRTAINFALKHPERTEALVVEDMTPRNVRSGANTVVRVLLNIGKEYLKSIPAETDLNTAKRDILNGILHFASEHYVHAEKFIEHYDLDMMPLVKVGDSVTTECDLNAIESMMDANPLVQDLPERYLAFDGVVLFLYGDLPFFNLPKDTSIRKLFPRAIVKKIEEASHMIHLDSPDAFAEVVSQFILRLNCHRARY